MSIGRVGPVLFPTMQPGQFRPEHAISRSGDVVEIQAGGDYETQKAHLREAVERGHRDIWVLGPASAGKAALVDDLCREMNHYPAVTVDVSRPDLIGGYMPVSRGEYKFMPTPFSRAVADGKWLTLTHVNRADNDALFCLQTLKDGESLTTGDLIAHPDTRFFVMVDTPS